MDDSRTATFRQGMTHNPLRAVAFTEAGLVDFPTEFPGGLTFKMTKGATVVTGSATGDASGNMTYQWATTDLDVAGIYSARFKATDGSGKTESFPRGYNLTIIVEPDI